MSNAGSQAADTPKVASIASQFDSEHTSVFHRLLEELERESAQGTRHPDHGRDSRRQSVHAPVSLGVVTGQIGSEPDPAGPRRGFKPLYRAWVTDLSPLGVGLLAEQDLPTGLKIWVDLGALVGRPLLMPVRLVYCKKLLSQTYRIGAGFLGVESAERV